MFLFLLLACPSENDVEAAIEDARGCETAEECVDVGSRCPFGCNIVVNKTEAEHITELMDSYDKGHFGSACMYDCAMAGEIVCEDHRCGRGAVDTAGQ